MGTPEADKRSFVVIKTNVDFLSLGTLVAKILIFRDSLLTNSSFFGRVRVPRVAIGLHSCFKLVNDTAAEAPRYNNFSKEMRNRPQHTLGPSANRKN